MKNIISLGDFLNHILKKTIEIIRARMHKAT